MFNYSSSISNNSSIFFTLRLRNYSTKCITIIPNKYLIKDTLVSYGNHTSNHYLLSSLNKQEQYEEIFKCKDYLNKQNVNKSEVFSIPFGGMNSYNKDTLTNLEDLNYKIILNSSNNLDKNKISNEINRFMPKTYNIENTLKKLYLKKITKL